MSWETVSPELALVDPELRARALSTLAGPPVTPRAPRPIAPPATSARIERPYPYWARVTAALWLLVLGILIGGAAVPHAQDRPRVVPKNEDPAICPAPTTEQTLDRPFGHGGP